MTTPEITRALAPSEAMFAGNQLYVGYSVRTSGELDLTALATAYEAVCRTYPVLAARLDTTADGEAVIVTSDARPTLGVGTGPLDRPLAGIDLEQSRALSGLSVTYDGSEASVTLATHHSIADAYHSFGVLTALWDRYTDAVEGVSAELRRHPYPKSVEQLLAERGIDQLAAAPADIEIPAELPAPPNSPATEPITFPMARLRLTAEQTTALAELGHRERITINGLLSAALLLAESDVRAVAISELVYVYPVNLRTRLTPQIGLTEGTNVLGFANFQSPTPAADPLSLAREVNAALHAGLAEGTIQRSALALSDPQAMAKSAAAISAGAVVATNWGPVPALRSPAELRLTDFRGTFHAKVAADIPDTPYFGGCYLVSTFGGRLSIEIPQTDADPAAGHARIDALRERLNHLLSGR
ncbi:phthiocerol/phthiodiolone dimycocerosyl transferase family protein [Nocardia pseudobrasiliensis]|uniref:Phthiocerol/phthiodiolone dimycocerosyl transferase n=1 Tax=Nocardia pseudobrasiliensis TaxID=45979 RepID=A0A370IAN3_9NOCA|nr:hypothetical protein [Nocardia pseudobrasiliensis]RDI67191.1 acetyltransferase [Nocardia pseudobrasiliensis]